MSQEGIVELTLDTQTHGPAATLEGDCRSAVDFFEIYISYIRHENELLNHRTTWLVAIESVLMAAAGYLFLQYSESFLAFVLGRPDSPVSQIVEFSLAWLAISYFGLVATIAGDRSIKAALLAQESINRDWERLFAGYPHYELLPFLRGGTDSRAAKQGEFLANELARSFLIFWILCIAGWAMGILYKLVMVLSG